MTLVTRKLPLLGLAIAVAGCAATTQAPPPPAPHEAPVAQVESPPPPADEWSVFPDPLTGHVEVYHNGQDVGSVTGEEKEDPPIPQRHKDDQLDEAP